MDTTIKTNSLKAWILAIRPKTLSGAAVPVLVGLALAWNHITGAQEHLTWLNNGIPALLCLLFALLMQIDANLINDYYDCIKGTDREDRLGPKRACAEGWITLPAMKKGIAVTTTLSCLIGLPLVLFGGWWLIAVGLACVVFAFLYTTQFSYWGLGDILVLVFFGLVPVSATYYLQLQPFQQLAFGWESLWAGLIIGLVTDNLLIVNNFRDRDQDRLSGKITLIVRIGATSGQRLYLGLGIMAVLMCLAFVQSGNYLAALLPWLYLPMHIKSWQQMKKIGSGKALNSVLGSTARNILVFGLLLALGFVL